MRNKQYLKKKYQTAKLVYDRFSDGFIILKSIDILAESVEDAEYYCNLYHPDLVITKEYPLYEEVLRVGKYYYNFNNN